MAKRGDAMRTRITIALREWPGLHLEAIARAARTSAPLALHHLTNLEIDGEASSIRVGRRRHYFLRDVPAGAFERIAIIRQPLPFALILSLLHQGRATHGALRRDLQFAGSTVRYHLSRLERMGLVRHGGPGAEYALSRPLDAEMMMRRYPPPKEILEAFGDVWGRFLRGDKSAPRVDHSGRLHVQEER